MISDAIIDDEDFKGSSINAMDEFLNAALSMNKLSNDERINAFGLTLVNIRGLDARIGFPKVSLDLGDDFRPR
ncbi:hypothetical protein H5410_057561 [Solanum commersonii]|uniref:Uncharacterized protein n=1 Tax=Solanum commersonii TaxID=4109 RepID=A0A9J5WN86_SOLCO|nr:hypothetical protein H5410_057561 [Solanum commersonii]